MKKLKLPKVNPLEKKIRCKHDIIHIVYSVGELLVQDGQWPCNCVDLKENPKKKIKGAKNVEKVATRVKKRKK